MLAGRREGVTVPKKKEKESRWGLAEGCERGGELPGGGGGVALRRVGCCPVLHRGFDVFQLVLGPGSVLFQSKFTQTKPYLFPLLHRPSRQPPTPLRPLTQVTYTLPPLTLLPFPSFPSPRLPTYFPLTLNTLLPVTLSTSRHLCGV